VNKISLETGNSTPDSSPNRIGAHVWCDDNRVDAQTDDSYGNELYVQIPNRNRAIDSPINIKLSFRVAPDSQTWEEPVLLPCRSYWREHEEECT